MIKALLWEIAARLGFWVPCNKHLPDKRYWDWVLISYYEPGLTYRFVPTIAEYSYTQGTWHGSETGTEEFINNMCKITHWHKIPRDKHLPIKPKNDDKYRDFN